MPDKLPKGWKRVAPEELDGGMTRVPESELASETALPAAEVAGGSVGRGAVYKGVGKAAKSYLLSLARSLGAPERLSDVIEGPTYAVRNPRESATMLLEGIAAPMQEHGEMARALLRSPDPVDKLRGVGEAIYGTVPFLGSIADTMVEQAETGDLPGLGGTITGTGMQIFGMRPTAPGPKVGQRSTMRVPRQRTAALTQTASELPKIAPAMTIFEVAETAKAAGVQLSVGQATRSMSGRAADWFGERSILSGARNLRVKNIEAVRGWVDRLMDRVNPRNLEPETAAMEMVEQVGKAGDAAKAAKDAAYNNLRIGNRKMAEVVNNVDLVDAQNVFDSLYNDPAGGALPKSPEAEQFLKEVRALAPSGGLTTFTKAKMLRTKFMEAGNTFGEFDPLKLSGEQRQAFNHIVTFIDEAMEEAIFRKGGDAAVEDWRSANALHKEYVQKFLDGSNKTLSKPYALYKNAQRTKMPDYRGAVAGLKDILASSSPDGIRILRENGVDVSILQRLALDRIRADRFRITAPTGPGGPRFGGFDQHFLAKLFEKKPDVLREMAAAGETGRALGFEMNPSQTGTTTSMLSRSAAVAAGLLSGDVMSGLQVGVLAEAPFAAGSMAATSKRLAAARTGQTLRTTPFAPGQGMAASLGTAAAATSKADELRKRRVLR